MTTFERIYSIFSNLLGVNAIANLDLYESEFAKLNAFIRIHLPKDKDLENLILSIVIKKLNLYNKQIKFVIDSCAKELTYFNYHEKNFITECVEANNKLQLIDFLRLKGICNIDKILSYTEYNKDEVVSFYHQIVDNDTNKSNIIESILSGYLFSVFPVEKIHSFNSRQTKYTVSFYQYLKETFPDKYNRSYTLSMLYINDSMYRKYGNYKLFLNTLLGFIKEQYYKLQNYGYFSILIDDIEDCSSSVMWSLYSDIVLYSEKFIEEHLKIGYFHPDVIAQKTSEYIFELDKNKASFDIANSGFTYRDCFIIPDEHFNGEEKKFYGKYKILILFQKNDRDEDVIPCPACRSFNVRGNSYPTLGVKSWECQNPLCPDKSKYNRGKRFSLSSIVKQEAIEDVTNEIERENLAEWRLDVVSPKTTHEIVEFLIKHYSFNNDTVFLFNIPEITGVVRGRKIKNETFTSSEKIDSDAFFESPYFFRFRIDANNKGNTKYKNLSPYKEFYIYNGDCKSVLQNIPSDFFDGAVTSPPYYNAKEYSQWNNIYCYLYDMYNHAKEVYRTLKPGAYFVYNIFDYFDNENNVVFSAMGKKRMILGAYIIHLFKHMGFELQQNVIWYKGNVQGHRSTNQGNNSPYYQAPINCYEHIFCFRKPGNIAPYIEFPIILKASPVIKMVKGKNILGHTAPYPEDIPNLIASKIDKGIVLDPYSGSFTTAKSAYNYHLKSVNIELSKDYCNLGLNLIKSQYYVQKNLFFDPL